MTLLATQITEALAARLRECTADAGRVSDVGRTVQVGRVRAGAIEAPCCYLVPARGSDDPHYGAVRRLRRYEVRAFADANAHPALSDVDLVDRITWDVRQTVESARLPGADAVRYVADTPGYREEGGTLVGTLIEYEVGYDVDPANPETAL